jgi:AcrR family transcriptional regulator
MVSTDDGQGGELFLLETTGGDREGADKRQQIVQALHRCIREKGYSRTSLTDIAVGAAMSPSHIRYYFSGKEGILEYYLEILCRDLIGEIRRIPSDDPAQWLRRFTGFYIGNARISQAGLAVIVEIFGIAMHDSRLRETKQKFDQELRDILTEFFQRAGCADGLTPAMAAELTRALDIGLKYNMAFAESLSAERELIFLAGINRLLQTPLEIADARAIA